uniref:Uncharacterized protein n=1 Tax=Ditylenchus dipsaci TaxID=166011 RepID=A0A915DJ53_9BILA
MVEWCKVCKARLHTLVPQISFSSLFRITQSIRTIIKLTDAVTVSKIKLISSKDQSKTREKPQQLLNHENSVCSYCCGFQSSQECRSGCRVEDCRWRIPILAMIEGRGNDRGQIGMACMDLRPLGIESLSVCRYQLYILLKVCLSIHEPVEVILPEVSAETSGAGAEKFGGFSFVTCVERKSVTSIQRRFFNDLEGIDLDALGVEHPTVGRLLADLKRIQRTHDFDYEHIWQE